MKIAAVFLFLFTLLAGLCVQAASGCLRGDCGNGFGEYVYANGDSYVGYWNDGVRYGGGTYHYKDGSRFVGTYANNMRHGKGTYTSASGQSLSGSWIKGGFANTNLRRVNSEVLLLDDDSDSVQEAILEAEAMALIDACTGYSDEDIRQFRYLYTLPGDEADELYFRFKAYNAGSYTRLPGVLELTLKFRKYHNGVYEQGIDAGRYYWDDCEELPDF